jgi:quercetin dioxygenase-like cupin family protein
VSIAPYPEHITRLPQIDLPIEGITGWLCQGEQQQIVYFELPPIAEIPPHSHGAQWGIVVEGQMDLTIAGETRRYGPGDSYYIPAGVVHSARFITKVRAIDVFEDKDRYRAKA